MWDRLVPLRTGKPRKMGVTMIMDKGLGMAGFHDLLEIAAESIDFIKLGFGTAALTPLEILEEKIALAKKAKVNLYLGGTFFEVAYAKNEMEHYFEILSQLGIDWVEISNGTIDLNLEQRTHAMKIAKERFQLRIITEIGKKTEGYTPPLMSVIEQFEHDRNLGADFIIIEGRETGENIGIYDSNGNVDKEYLTSIQERLEVSSIIWEAPQKKQQTYLLKRMGRDVNLGNIAPEDILSVESLRRGLRADTFESSQSTQGER